MYLRPFLLTVVLALVHFCGRGQASTLGAGFESDSITLEPGRVFSNNLIIINKDGQTVAVDSIVAARNYPGLLFVPEFKGSLKAGAQQLLRIRMIADQALLISDITRIIFTVYYVLGGAQYKKNISFELKRPVHKYVFISAQGGELYFNPDVEENPVRLMIHNPAFIHRDVAINFDLQPAEHLRPDRPLQIVSLAPGERKLLSLQLQKKGRSSYYPDYSLIISVKDLQTSETILNTSFLIRSLSNKKNIQGLSTIDADKNFAALNYNRSNKYNEFFRLRSNIQTKISGQKTLLFNTALEYYNRSDFLSIYDTRLELRSARNQFAIGNIIGSGFDLNIAGRGAQVVQKVGTRDFVEVVGIQNNFLLYSSLPSSFDPGYTVGAKYIHQTTRKKPAQVAYTYAQNSYNRTQANIINAQLPLYEDASQHLQLETGLSTEQSLSTNRNHPGIAGGINYQLSRKNISLVSYNYFSTPYYAGLRRGVFNWFETLRLPLSPRSNLTFNYSGSYNDPRYSFADSNLLYIGFQSNKFVNHQAEVGLNYTLNSLTIGITPNYTFQEYLSLGSGAYEAFRTRFSISKFLSLHSLNLSADYGWATLKGQGKKFMNARLGLNYRINGFFVDGTADLNPVNIYTAVTASTADYKIYALSSGYNIPSNKKKIHGSVFAGYNYFSGLKNNSLFANANINYPVSPLWQFTATGNYSVFNTKISNLSSRFNNLQFSVGLRYSFDHLVSSRANNIVLELFEDLNKNTLKDGKEKAIPGAIVKLNGYIIAVTDANGKVKFNNVPDGRYSISALSNNQSLTLLNRDSVDITQSKKLAVSIVKTSVIKGSLAEEKDPYNNELSDITGIIIYAREKSTGKVMSTVTDTDGSFAFQFLDGVYDLYIENNRYEVLNNHQEVVVDKDRVITPVTFRFRNKSVKIRVRQF